MKNTLILTVLALFALTSCGGKEAGTKTEDAAGAEIIPQEIVEGAIAYVNLDSLMRHYDFVKDKGGELEQEAKRVETELTNEGRSLERAFASAQEKIEKGLVTRAQAAQLEQDLMMRQQTLMQNRDQRQMELAEKEQVFMNNFYHNLSTYIEEYNAGYKYSMILSTSGGSPILNANPALDITMEIVNGLNEEYKKEAK